MGMLNKQLWGTESRGEEKDQEMKYLNLSKKEKKHQGTSLQR